MLSSGHVLSGNLGGPFKSLRASPGQRGGRCGPGLPSHIAPQICSCHVGRPGLAGCPFLPGHLPCPGSQCPARMTDQTLQSPDLRGNQGCQSQGYGRQLTGHLIPIRPSLDQAGHRQGPDWRDTAGCQPPGVLSRCPWEVALGGVPGQVSVEALILGLCEAC